MRWMFFALLFGAPLLLSAQKTPAGARWSFDPARKAWAVVNPKGVTCSDFVFQDPVPFRQGLAAARKGERYFLVLSDGSLLPDSFDLLLPATEGYYFGWTKNAGSSWINVQGKDTLRVHRNLPTPGIGRQRVYESEKKYGLLDSNGLFLTPALYDNLGRARGEDAQTYIARVNKHFGLLNSRGKVVFPLECESIESWGEDFLVFRQNGKYGTLNAAGSILIPAQYDAIKRIYQDGPIQVKKGDRTGILDKRGRELIPPQYEDVQPCFPPIISYKYQEGKKCGIIDSTGKVVTPARYDQLFAYGSGIYDAVENGLHGVVDFDGNTIVPCRFQSLTMSAYGTFLVKEGSQWTLLGPKGESLLALPAQYEPYAYACSPARQLFSVLQQRKFGLMDRQQRLVLPLEYGSLSGINDTLLIVSKDGKYGLLNPVSRQEITPMVYDRISPLDSSLLLVFQQKGQYGLLDRSGKEVCPARYINIRSFGNHQVLGERVSALRTKDEDASGFGKTEAVVKDDGSSGDGGNTTCVFLDSSGQEIPKLKFTAVGDLRGGLARVKIDRKEGWIDADARLVYPVEFIEFENLNGYTRVRQYGTGFWGIWSAGKEVIPCQYDAIGAFFDGYVRAKKGETRLYVDEHNREPVLSRAEAAQQLKLPAKVLDAYEAFGLPGEENGWIRVRQDGKWGWIDAQGKEQIACRFDAATPFRDGRARVLVPGYYNDLWVNVKGEVLLGQ